MRIRYLLCATLALAPDGIAHAATDDSQLEEIVVTARRAPEPRLNFAGSLSRLNAQAIDLEGATHYSELLNRVPGVYVQRGSGQESLVAIRSPVLNGAGACGAFLMLEDGLPIRPVGFCNVNEMFELNTEQADAIEVIRGPGPAIYGANAMHGIVNVITPAAKELSPLAVALEGGTNDYKRVKFKTSTDTIGAGAGMYGLYTNDGGYRANSGDEEGKVNLLADTQLGSGTLRIRGAGTLLNQRTAGFVQGFDAYGNPALRTSNPNPEAFRDAWRRASRRIGRASPAAAAVRLCTPLCADRECGFCNTFCWASPWKTIRRRASSSPAPCRDPCLAGSMPRSASMRKPPARTCWRSRARRPSAARQPRVRSVQQAGITTTR